MSTVITVLAPSEQHCHAFCDYIPATRSTWHHGDCSRRTMRDPLPAAPAVRACHPFCDYIFGAGMVHHPDCANWLAGRLDESYDVRLDDAPRRSRDALTKGGRA
jgi:hypothetical protein